MIRLIFASLNPSAVGYIVVSRLLRQLQLRQIRTRCLPDRVYQRPAPALLKNRQQLQKRTVGIRAEKLALALHHRRRPPQILHHKAPHRNLVYRRLPFAADGVRPRIIRPHKRSKPHSQHRLPSLSSRVKKRQLFSNFYPYLLASRSKNREISCIDRCDGPDAMPATSIRCR